MGIFPEIYFWKNILTLMINFICIFFFFFGVCSIQSYVSKIVEELGICLFYHSFRQEHSKTIPEKANWGFPVFTAYCNNSSQLSEEADGLTGTPASHLLPSHFLNKMAPDANFSQPYGSSKFLETALKSISAQFYCFIWFLRAGVGKRVL